jgi:NAD(P)-dependent dehydrogenase (short-subunit alcohol dehydrogenase family)
MGRLAGKTALVTGASAGLGRHFAQTLAREGAQIIACARRSDALGDLAAALQAEGLMCHAVTMDVTDPQSVARAFAEAQTITGGAIDILVNNAGSAQTKAAIDLTEEDWTGIIDLNLNGVFRAAQAAAKQMIAAGKPGAIVNIASILGLGVGPALSSYAASKAAVIHLTKTLALEWARYNIRVNALAPGYFVTDLNRDFFESPAGEKMIARIPTRRIGDLEDLSEPLLLLCGDGGRHMTGSVIVVDGGHAVRSL